MRLSQLLGNERDRADSTAPLIPDQRSRAEIAREILHETRRRDASEIFARLFVIGTSRSFISREANREPRAHCPGTARQERL